MPQIRLQKLDQPILDKRPRTKTLHPKRRKLRQPGTRIDWDVIVNFVFRDIGFHVPGCFCEVAEVFHSELVLEVVVQVSTVDRDVRLVRFSVFDLGTKMNRDKKSPHHVEERDSHKTHVRQRLDEIKHRRRLLPCLLRDI